ncbi:unnamed protein product [Caenorhabditis bovis]|uniref:Uncharacterized protein n=1 Tax=Caenorhabditis bovis TaxID=2654633 RepID=A0A8S1E8I0_9PELO|nr:unnamed protein product [Caenorhabditis bovis]
MKQFSGDVFQEASKILLEKYGSSIFDEANEVIEEIQAENEMDVENARKKREVGYEHKESGTCRGPPKNCQLIIHDQVRSITGLCNNRAKSKWGNSVSPIRRLTGKVSYQDGLNEIRRKSVTGADLPSARLISNKLHDEGAEPNFSPNINHLHMQVGQFIAHDIIFMPSSVAKDGSTLDCNSCEATSSVSPNCAPIPVPADDKYFKSADGSKRCIRLTRALNGQTGFGARTQIDQNSHFIDLSVVYGSSDCEAESLRSFQNGLLRDYRGEGYILPPQDKNDSNCQSRNPNYCFLAGDFRNSLHPALIPLHTVFLKEHNRHAKKVKQIRPNWNDEQIYQLVRKVMIGMWQHHVYNEYLPELLSDKYLTDFDLKPMKPRSGKSRKYDESKNPALSAEFAAAAFRFGHSQARQHFMRQDANNNTVGSLDLGSNIFYANELYRQAGGWETLLNGMMTTSSMNVDRYFSFPIRNQLFETRNKPGSGVDLVAINIMRGRDLGLMPYTHYRQTVGLPAVRSWNDLSSTFSQKNIEALKGVYASPDDIDLYTGIVMENPVNGGLVGPTASYIIAEQFEALRKGDRFFYDNEVRFTDGFKPEEVDALRRTKLAKLICENTDIIDNVNINIFDLNSKKIPCKSIPDLDINAFIR